MSPVTKGLLARSRKGSVLLPPSLNQTKVLNFFLKLDFNSAYLGVQIILLISIYIVNLLL
jgi:hypothetical protein